VTDREDPRRIADEIAVAVLSKRKPASQPGAAPPPEPIPLEPEFITAEWESWWLPEPVGAWVDAAASALGVPKAMAIAAVLCSAATVLQGKATVRIHESWEEPLSLYWLVFSPTGSRKSALLKAAAAPVRALQDARRRELEPEIRSAKNEKARLEQQIARMRRAVKAHKYTEGALEHLQQLRELEHEYDTLEVPLPPRWLYDDINPTMVPRKWQYSHDAEGIARVAVLDSEGTFLSNLLGRHSGHLNVDPLLKGYMGESVDMVRAVHGSRETLDINLPAVHLTMLLLIQPHFLDAIRAKPELGTNGLLGRCLMTHLRHSNEPLPLDAPGIPDAVQDAYARWVATLAAVPEGTVWEMPKELRNDLRKLHDQLEQDRVAELGATGFIVRTLGRICRIIAICELSQLSQPLSQLSQPNSQLSQLSHCRTVSGGVNHTRVLSRLTYLYSVLYSRALSQSRAIEPTSDPMARLTRRALAWLAAATVATVATVTLRKLCNALHINKNAALELCDSLVESGHLEPLETRARLNKTLTVTYRVISTDPTATTTAPEQHGPHPRPFLASLPTGTRIPEPPPDPDPDSTDLDGYLDDLLDEELEP
jgi:hypothetical protein